MTTEAQRQTMAAWFEDPRHRDLLEDRQRELFQFKFPAARRGDYMLARRIGTQPRDVDFQHPAWPKSDDEVGGLL